MHFDGRLPCGCHIKPSFIRQACGPHELTQCPLHRNADKLLDVCKLLVAYCTDTGGGFADPALDRIREIIEKAEAKPEKETSDV